MWVSSIQNEMNRRFFRETSVLLARGGFLRVGVPTDFMAKPTPMQQLQDQANLPPTRFGKAMTAMPVVMTVIATLLAGLASSEMTKAQYQRAYGAQLQSKAGDQWAFFQAKRLRGEMQRNTLDILNASASAAAPLPAAESEQLAPAPEPAPAPSPEIAAALQAIEADEATEVINPLLVKLSFEQIENALRVARERAKAYDAITTPLRAKLEKTEGSLAPRLRFNASRYDYEAQLNAGIARLLELQVRRTNLTAERHHLRSQRFFFGMLAAQAGVIVATLALAARQRNLLWIIAAGAGLVAVVFAVYVYLYV